MLKMFKALTKFFKFSKCSKLSKFLKWFKLSMSNHNIYQAYDAIWYDFANMFNTNKMKYLYFEQTADKMTHYNKAILRTILFRINMIWIVMIHVILKHVATCWNMSKLVQIQYDMNCYDYYHPQSCLNLSRFNMI